MNTHISIDGMEITITSNGQPNCSKSNSESNPDKHSENGKNTGSIIQTHFDLDKSERRTWNVIMKFINEIKSLGEEDV